LRSARAPPTSMPIERASALMSCRSSAAATYAFVGAQATFGQLPPQRPRSTTATDAPYSAAAFRAASRAAEPVPITIRSKIMPSPLSSDELSVRSDDEPRAAELSDVLAEHLQRLRVADVGVERSPGVGELDPSVAPVDRADQPRIGPGSGRGAVRDDVRRPRLGTGPAAIAAPGGVLGERVEGEATAVEEDRPIPGVADGDSRAA